MINLVGKAEFENLCSDRDIILVGAGRKAVRFVNEYNWNYRFAIDNLSSKHNTLLKTNREEIPIKDWTYLRENASEKDVLIVTPGLEYIDLVESIEADSRLKNNDTYVLRFIDAIQWDLDRISISNQKMEFTKSETPLIPPIIHYFWFSNDPYPDKVKRCIDSWHKYCPKYEFKEWNLDNYHTENVFCNEALSKKEWAFASDYGRCDVVYRYGGIYLDTDVELLKPLDDFLYDEGFFCFQGVIGGIDPGSGMGAISRKSVLGEIRDKYEGVHFVREDGSFNKIPINDQYTDVLIKAGLTCDGSYQVIDNVAVYPPLVFSPYSYMTGIMSISDISYGVHHWVSAHYSGLAKRELIFRKNYISSRIKSINNCVEYF